MISIRFDSFGSGGALVVRPPARSLAGFIQKPLDPFAHAPVEELGVGGGGGADGGGRRGEGDERPGGLVGDGRRGGLQHVEEGAVCFVGREEGRR